MSDAIIAAEHHDRPVAFTQDEIGWAPWLEPLAESELTDRHWAGLVDASRAKSPYFMLLARDPRNSRSAHQDRQGYLLQSRRRPAARRA